MQTPEQSIATFVVLGIGIAAAVALRRWLFSGPRQPDPWSEQIAGELESPESASVCHRCLTEQAPCAHFCPKCGVAVGDYNNCLPFEQIFSEGEVLRNGTSMKVRPSFVVVAGYLVLTLTAYSIFAPVYWYFFIRNLLRSRDSSVAEASP